jgi:hypothetical protein
VANKLGFKLIFPYDYAGHRRSLHAGLVVQGRKGGHRAEQRRGRRPV